MATEQQTAGRVISLFDQGIDDFSSCLPNFELDYRQLDQGVFRARTIAVDLDGIQLKRRTTSICHGVRGCLPPALVFYFPLRPLDLFVNGNLVSPSMQMVSASGGKVFAIVPGGYDHLLVCVGEPELRQHLDSAQTERFLELAARIDFCHVNTQRKLSLTRHLFELYCALVYRRDEPGEAECSDSRRRIVNLLCDYLMAHPNAQRKGPSSQERLLQRALVLIDNHPDRVFSLEDLSREVYASKRAIQYAFDTLVGMSPMRYMKLIRLNRIRKDLRAQGPRARFGSLVGKHHFSNAGRILREYTDLFGERPHDTARQP